MSIAERLSLLSFKFAWAAARFLPKSVFVSLFILAGRFVFWRNGNQIKRLKFNLALVLGSEPDSAQVLSLSRSAFLNYMRYWAELFALASVSNDDLHKYVDFVGLEILQNAVNRGNGVLVVAPHSGNWDLAGAVAATEFGRLTSVAERLKPEELFQLFVKSREPRGIEILPHRGGERPAFEILIDRLVSGGLVGMATDRDMSRSGVPVNFFGAQAKMPSGPARLFQKTNCAVVPVKVFFVGQKTRIEFLSELEMTGTIEADTQVMADVLAEIIRANPNNWFMLQQIWLDHPKEWGGR
ncbi:MAG: hypothetical protein RL038_130 [Actinomycetota bacterium]